MSHDQSVALARASYDRCQKAPEFFQAFYDRFFDESPSVRPMFATTDLGRQQRLLKHAIGLLLSYRPPEPDQPNILSRVAHRHGREDLKIDPALYPGFINSLMRTVASLDPEFTPAIGAAWREATADGIAYMQSKA